MRTSDNIDEKYQIIYINCLKKRSYNYCKNILNDYIKVILHNKKIVHSLK